MKLYINAMFHINETAFKSLSHRKIGGGEKFYFRMQKEGNRKECFSEIPLPWQGVFLVLSVQGPLRARKQDGSFMSVLCPFSFFIHLYRKELGLKFLNPSDMLFT